MIACPTVRGIVFDFDGTIIDTETPEFVSWREVYDEYGCELPFDEYSACIGTTNEAFDVYGLLETLCGRKLDREAVRLRRRERYHKLLLAEPLRPGVFEWLDIANQKSLTVGIASCSRSEHVYRLLDHHDIRDRFKFVATGDMVSRVKPDPEVYLTALARLGLSPHETLAVEDSPNGVMAAKTAGMYCICVPNSMTSALKFDVPPDMFLTSLADASLTQLINAGKGRLILASVRGLLGRSWGNSRLVLGTRYHGKVSQEVLDRLGVEWQPAGGPSRETFGWSASHKAVKGCDEDWRREYERRYTADVRSNPQSKQLFRSIVASLDGGNDVVFACYCKTSTKCHRSIVGKWFQTLGYTVNEAGAIDNTEANQILFSS